MIFCISRLTCASFPPKFDTCLIAHRKSVKTISAGAPWGVGLLGFAPQDLLDEQLAAVKKYRPAFAVIAGGRPDQALKLEEAGIVSFLHVPAANLIPLFLQEGARRFIFEGRECGGHIGPLSSFVLWSTMVDRLLFELSKGEFTGRDIYVLFAGGIHDAVSSASSPPCSQTFNHFLFPVFNIRWTFWD